LALLYIHQMNRVNYRNDLRHDDSTIEIPFSTLSFVSLITASSKIKYNNGGSEHPCLTPLPIVHAVDKPLANSRKPVWVNTMSIIGAAEVGWQTPSVTVGASQLVP